VQLPEVDRVEAEPAQAVLAVGSQALRTPVGMAPASEAALGGDHQPFGIRVQRLGDEVLRAAVGMRSVDQVDPEPHRLAQDLAGRARALGLAPNARQPHGAEPEPVDIQHAADCEGARPMRGHGILFVDHGPIVAAPTLVST
jgi:hypothetical protein